MANKPKPKVMSIQGSHFDITGPGPFLLPALFSPLSIVDRGEEDRALIRAVSDENQQLQLDISI